jgi:hypothetical protein
MQFLLFLSAAGFLIMTFKLIEFNLYPDMYWGLNHPSLIMILIGLLLVMLLYIAAVPYIYGGVWYSGAAIAVTNVPPAALFGCYSDPSRIARALCVEFALILRKGIVFVPVLLTCATELLLTYRVVSVSRGFLPIAATGGCVLSLIGLFMLYKVYALRYFAVRFIFTEEPGLSANDMIKRSLSMSKGKLNVLIALYLRLLPLKLACIFVFPLVFVPPIITNCYAYAYRDMKA